MIPMVDLKIQYALLKDEIDAGLHSALDSCAFILGPNVQAFEQESAQYLGVKHAIGVASGTDALHFALLAAGVKAGDEVITTAFTFIATAEAIRYIGAKPVFVDIDPRTFNIDPAAIEAAITERTTAVMPVHLFGQPCDMAAIQALCERHGLKLVEDCAQSFGATEAGRQTGSIGLAAGFSFFPSKNLGGYGDGGLVTTDSDDMALHIKSLRNHGSQVRYYHDEIGYNSRLDELQAVILRVKLKRIDAFNEGRRRAAHLYSELMADLPLETPHEDGIGAHVYHQYTLLSDRRDAIMQALQQQKIGCAVYYPVPLHQQKVFAENCKGQVLPVTEAVAARCLSLPIYPELTEAQIREIVAVIRSVPA
ncbi:DegT/DnrJ/EryC1/StrS family aminotransferase [Candidatus Methylospira mobilis]|uniref:DegT/DnrJ/EryC1/StrS family aminotransferase n=1 Tax=Candidatus Methylospira mobilis TaxID=1808979 RepID=A0A5Q0BQL3_9GAMM|nr:DegT/DnrJ/EryC1/StrS family aminotransferase [Candidatus Methylospira mobilis]QFY43986.1 DegT/DnrJ/EryC1/StrS family aminotransferase [Candidatus Methylospira mobilis]WNV04986.1 DegT/DnrJ/EryC1/StrS family aminotransferase [Candidatus Methylospira mobilis]